MSEHPAVTLRPVTPDNVRALCALDPGPGMHAFVAPNAVSLAEAYVHPLAWPRAVYAGEEPVGFIMLSLDTERAQYWVWRFMVDHRHQRRGIGAAALKLAVAHVRALPGAREVRLSFVDAPGSPEPFYRRLGFARTGEIEDGEHVMALDLAAPPA
uniref:GNAT family N-acetyltransferase n=1 Tax=Eiseniibacteriota bacterium TaxID=2212470 RepID=A0A832MM98_UNCEI